MAIEASITPQEAVTAVETLAQVNWTKIWGGLTSGDTVVELTSVADIAGFVSTFVPDAKYVEDAVELLAYVAAAKQAGLWAPGQPEDPSMQHADGPTSPNMSGG